ncbi:MAG: L-serine ammonia-lyase, iron-sulfur-dependent, subunit alpha [Lachnospiraceae bacterium]|nr:L-serine ammonia-lyase, iron-sulfur-dependent, subunit alpha [Lachnospiraceae bacterium]
MFESMEALCMEAQEKNIPFWELVMIKDCDEQLISKEQSFETMKKMYDAMKASDKDYDKTLVSKSGLIGGEGEKMRKRKLSPDSLVGDVIAGAMEKALRVSESNACMKRIVAAPTAGSCGVIPAVFLTVQEERQIEEDKMIEALYVASGVGGVIASRASLSGAEGGCQAEIGSASAMAAAGLAHILGGGLKEISNAAAIALKGLLGLACDPVAGLVEVPCVKRNVIGAVNAITSAEMAMAGIESKIPADEVFDAMKSIGRSMSETVKETAQGGLAITPTGIKIKENISSL